jgi:hypothetical protein
MYNQNTYISNFCDIISIGKFLAIFEQKEEDITLGEEEKKLIEYIISLLTQILTGRDIIKANTFTNQMFSENFLLDLELFETVFNLLRERFGTDDETFVKIEEIEIIKDKLTTTLELQTINTNKFSEVCDLFDQLMNRMIEQNHRMI